METTIDVRTKGTVKQKLSDILLDISMAKISTKYFEKSRSWLYHKLDGIDGNGKPTDFTAEEKETLRAALKDLSSRIDSCADSL
ncbi:DUF5053 domain-containing protein [Avrilella dinanensis]|uniref:DUF5053 domain-containing protein n=1 Tax=Avrilella dinanensis TaxID=2008672 RepID=A0A2M9R608_9FLAO|nr:DUF5053 domain-containing protein [Avrilella dinanensis]PJR04308.1 DUF5053 domain-containing protein [Avrilella dinanensis]